MGGGRVFYRFYFLFIVGYGEGIEVGRVVVVGVLDADGVVGGVGG